MGRAKEKMGTTVIIMGRKPASAAFYRPTSQEGEGKKPIWTDGMHVASASTEARNFTKSLCWRGENEPEDVSVSPFDIFMTLFL
jgi:hypothetical protein